MLCNTRPTVAEWRWRCSSTRVTRSTRINYCYSVGAGKHTFSLLRWVSRRFPASVRTTSPVETPRRAWNSFSNIRVCTRVAYRLSGGIFGDSDRERGVREIKNVFIKTSAVWNRKIPRHTFLKTKNAYYKRKIPTSNNAYLLKGISNTSSVIMVVITREIRKMHKVEWMELFSWKGSKSFDTNQNVKTLYTWRRGKVQEMRSLLRRFNI